MELRGRIDGEEGVVAEKMDKVLWREGAEKEGEEIGLRGEGGMGGEVVADGRGGKSKREVRGGI